MVNMLALNSHIVKSTFFDPIAQTYILISSSGVFLGIDHSSTLAIFSDKEGG
jgi:hypothetical protein